MQFNLIKNIEKIMTTFSKMSNLPKTLIKYGGLVFLVLFTVGNGMVLLNHTVLIYNSYFDFVSKSIVGVSISIAAETIIGGLILDYVFKK